MRRKIFGCMLIGCLMLGLSACGDVKVATTDENGSTQVTTVPVEEVVESVVESIEEEAESYVWSEHLHEMFKPAFDAHPIFKGEMVVGCTYEEISSRIGEATVIQDGWRWEYNTKNSAGNEVTGLFEITKYQDGREVANNFEYFEETVTDEYFDVDNDYYAITHEKYLELQKFLDDLAAEGKTVSDIGYTYEDIAEMLGVPGFVMAVDVSNSYDGYVTIRWVNPEGDRSVGERYVNFMFRLDGTL